MRRQSAINCTSFGFFSLQRRYHIFKQKFKCQYFISLFHTFMFWCLKTEHRNYSCIEATKENQFLVLAPNLINMANTIKVGLFVCLLVFFLRFYLVFFAWFMVLCSSFCLSFCIGFYLINETTTFTSLEGLALCGRWTLSLNCLNSWLSPKPLCLSKLSIIFLLAPSSWECASTF